MSKETIQKGVEPVNIKKANVLSIIEAMYSPSPHEKVGAALSQFKVGKKTIG